MKNTSVTQCHLCALGLWLLSQCCGQCFYDPGPQRWINRDPIGELGGQNLYAFAANDAVDLFDLFGLMDIQPPTSTEPDRDCMAKCEAQYNSCVANATMASLGVGGAAGGGQIFNKTGIKPPGGVAGGGLSGRFSSRTRLNNWPCGKTIGRVPVGTATLIGIAVSSSIGLLSAVRNTRAVWENALQKRISAPSRGHRTCRLTLHR
jgi:hypothetical protein